MTAVSGSNGANGIIESFSGTVDLIKSEHLNAARASVKDEEILKELEAEIERDCESLRSFLFAAQVINLLTRVTLLVPHLEE